MNEQRQQAYLNLIRSLLDSPSGEEPKILAANQELLDAGFMQTVEEVAVRFSQQGNNKTANWLRNLANYLRETLNLDNKVDLQSLSEEEIQKYYQFLMQVLKATSDSKGNPQVVYPFLAKNTDKLDEVLAEILRRWGTNSLGEAKAEEAEYLAQVIFNFSNLIQQFPLGDKASNMEIAINGYEVVLTVCTREAWHKNWAVTQNNLGFAYNQRIKGDKADNIENAIAAITATLTVYTREALPQDWAITQNNLAYAYKERIKGDKAENIENAIAASAAALTVYTKEAFPFEWARTQTNLAAAYTERIKGDKADNIENAIAAITATLTVYTREAFPHDWAKNQNNLGVAYRDRIKGDKAENTENAIAASAAALTVYTKEAFPFEWAMAQNNLAVVYRERIKGDKAENTENAIAASAAVLTVFTTEALPFHWAKTQINLAGAYTERIKGDKAENIENAIAASTAALTVSTREAFPFEWAMTQNNLGLAYRERIKGDEAENIENAIAAYTAALTVFTRKAFPQYWAMMQSNLGIAYRERIKGDEVENIEKAIAAYDAALTIYTKDALPLDWAITQNNLAGVYRDRIKGDKAENIEKAITCSQNALEFMTYDAFPQKYGEALFGLGIAYQNVNQLNLAHNAFESVIATIESLREEIVSGEESKRKQAEHSSEVYRRMVEVCLELGKKTEAIEHVERSKTRNLVEQILERDSRTIFPPDVVTQLETYRDEIATGQYQIQNGKAENPQDLAKYLQELRQQRNELQNRYLPVGYGFKFDSFERTLDERTAILEWYILDDKILAFIVTQTGEVKVWQSSTEDREAFLNWGNKYLRNYYTQKDQWQNSLGEELKELASVLHIDKILTQIPKHCDKLILIPHLFLHLFPLHTIPVNQNSQNSSSLLDLFPGGVSYAPSCQLLQQVQKRERPDFQSLFAIQNPTEDLDFTDLEVETILSYFPSYQVLTKKQATKAALSQAERQLKQANYLHFSCHGSFNFNSPQNSCLLLAESVDENNNLDLTKCLTLGNLFERTFDFSQTRLVVLSACETGLVDFNNTSDEYISLPSGFLYAGSSSVVSSLWTVSDLSTAFLMIKFIQNLRAAKDMSVPLAMNQAQIWLRDASIKDILEWSKKSQLNQNIQQEIQEELELHNPNEKHFSSPFHWAAFCAIGQ